MSYARQSVTWEVAEMKTCGICGDTGEPVKREGITPDLPDGWGTVTVRFPGEPVKSRILCGPCVNVVRVLLAREARATIDIEVPS